jgi:tetratricopeptide (TPR) repeat protein
MLLAPLLFVATALGQPAAPASFPSPPLDAPLRLASAPRLALAPNALPAAGTGEAPPSLRDARHLAAQLRYEEAIVEYQRYLGDVNRPVAERALALLELGFLHQVLGDEVSAQARATQALELDPWLKLAPGAPAKQLALLESTRKKLAAQARLEVLPRAEADAPQAVRARLADPQGKVKRVLLRHALSPKGPFYSTPMRCEDQACLGDLPPPGGGDAFTAFYYVEALAEGGETLAQAASATAPLQLSVVGRDPWFKRPWVWGATGAAVVAVAAVVYLLAPPPPK